MLNIILKISEILIIGIVGFIAGNWLMMLYLVKKHAKEKHICNHCEAGFLTNPSELDYKFCPYCSRPLDYHYKDERSQSYKGENDNDSQT